MMAKRGGIIVGVGSRRVIGRGGRNVGSRALAKEDIPSYSNSDRTKD